MRQEMMGFWDGSGISWTIYKQSAPHWIQRDNYTNTSSLYRLDAVLEKRPTSVVVVVQLMLNKQ